jgi:hypothetical protein
MPGALKARLSSDVKEACMIWKARTLKIILVTTCLAVAIGASGGAHAQYLPNDPLQIAHTKLTTEQLCHLWAEKHIGADHVPAECEIYVDPIPDTKAARDKVDQTQTSVFILCINAYMRARNASIIAARNLALNLTEPQLHPGNGGRLTPEEADSNFLTATTPDVLDRVRVCQEDNALTDKQVHEILAKLSDIWNTISSGAIINQTTNSPEVIAILLTYWTKAVANILQDIPE